MKLKNLIYILSIIIFFVSCKSAEEYFNEAEAAFKAKDYESLPSRSTLSTRAWDGEGTKATSQRDQREPKLMGDKPKFNKNKF